MKAMSRGRLRIRFRVTSSSGCWWKGLMVIEDLYGVEISSLPYESRADEAYALLWHLSSRSNMPRPCFES